MGTRFTSSPSSKFFRIIDSRRMILYALQQRQCFIHYSSDNRQLSPKAGCPASMIQADKSFTNYASRATCVRLDTASCTCLRQMVHCVNFVAFTIALCSAKQASFFCNTKLVHCSYEPCKLLRALRLEVVDQYTLRASVQKCVLL